MTTKKKIAVVLTAIASAISLVIVPILSDAAPQWELALAALSGLGVLFVKSKPVEPQA